MNDTRSKDNWRSRELSEAKLSYKLQINLIFEENPDLILHYR